LEGSERIAMISYSFENIGYIVPGFEGKSLKASSQVLEAQNKIPTSL